MPIPPSSFSPVFGSQLQPDTSAADRNAAASHARSEVIGIWLNQCGGDAAPPIYGQAADFGDLRITPTSTRSHRRFHHRGTLPTTADSRGPSTNPRLQPEVGRNGVDRSISGCHCTPTAKAPLLDSMASTTPSGATALDTSPSPSRDTAWWCVEFTISCPRPTSSASIVPSRTSTGCERLGPVVRLLVVARLGEVALDVLEQRAAQHHVEQLHPAAHPEHRHVPPERRLEQRRLEPGPRRLERSQPLARSLAVRLGWNVERAARHHQPGDAVEEGVDVPGSSRAAAPSAAHPRGTPLRRRATSARSAAEPLHRPRPRRPG